MRIAKSDLATVLVCCPYLQLLHLVRLYNFTIDANNPSSTTADQSATLDDMKFFQRVAVLCPKITSLHVSHSTQRLAIDTAVALWTLFPLVTDWSLLDLDAPGLLTPSFLTRSINVLTWLEINTIPCVGPSALVLFHDFLCEASHLLHLKTGLALPLEPLDLEGNLTLKGYYRIKGDPELSSHDFSFQSPNYVRTKDRPRTIWACRNLRTLDVIFARQSGDTNSLDNSRLIFSYLSKVCPNLEDLTVNYRRVRFELQGGLCLLSRLHRLRRLVLMTDQRPEMQQRDLEWMSRQFSVAMQAKQLMLALMLVMGEPKDLDPLAPFTLPMDTIQGGRGRTADNKDLDYMIGGVDMRNLGRIRDITSLIDERTSKNWVCWPLIEEIQLLVDPYRGYYVGVNESISLLVKNLRPDIRFVHDIHTRS
ncbi:hypothetical protein BG000_000666 [Podila horticola]|nr:hypothetical protein BG000_000666 [Podila horticola]